MTKRESCRGCILSMGVTIETPRAEKCGGGGGGGGEGAGGAGGLSSFVLLNAHTIILL